MRRRLSALLTALRDFLANPGRENKRLVLQIKLLERELDTARLTARNAIDKATDAQARLNEAHEREAKVNADHISTLKTITNSVVIASGSRIRMFDGYGPTLPESTVKGTPEPISSRLRARDIVNQKNREFSQATQEPFNVESFILERLPRTDSASAPQ